MHTYLNQNMHIPAHRPFARPPLHFWQGVPLLVSYCSHLALHVWVCMYVCVHICTFRRWFVCLFPVGEICTAFIYVCERKTHLLLFILFACMYMFVWMYMYIYMYNAYVCLYIYVCIYIHIHVRSYMHICMKTLTFLFLSHDFCFHSLNLSLQLLDFGLLLLPLTTQRRCFIFYTYIDVALGCNLRVCVCVCVCVCVMFMIFMYVCMYVCDVSSSVRISM